jgi:putative heme-binding domain-containing protein
MEHRQGPAALTAALEAATLPPDVAKLAARLAGSSARPDENLIAALRIAGGLGSTPREPSPEEIQQLVAEVASQADPARGELVYRLAANACQKCHAIAGAGGQVGPDLVSIGASAQVDYLVESILLPNKAVKEGYHSLSVVTVDGLVYSGIRVRETDRELVLRTAEDRLVTIPRDTIDEQAAGISLMPAGLAENLTRQELVDVVRFLSELGRTPSYRVDNRRLARRWQALEPTPETLEHLRRNRLGAAAGQHPSFIWSPLYSRVDGTLPMDDLPLLASQKGAYLHLPQASAVRCELESTTGGAVRLALNDPTALLLWLDGQPLDAAGTIDLDLPAGRHALTCIVDRQQRTAPLSIELVDLPGSAAQVQWVTGK